MPVHPRANLPWDVTLLTQGDIQALQIGHLICRLHRLLHPQSKQARFTSDFIYILVSIDSNNAHRKHVFTSQPYQWLPEYYPYIPNLAPGYQPLGHDTNNSIAYVPLVFNNKGPVTLPTPPAHPSEFETYARPIFPYAVPNTQSLHHAHWNNINDLPAQNYSISQVHSCDSSNSSDRSNRSSISTASGTSIQQSRSVLVQKLKPNATWQNLREYLRSAGVVERCEVYNNRRSGQNGTAKATFRSTEEAQKAVSLFDNSYFWGSRIRVTLGEESSGSGLANGYNSGKNNDVVHAEHELLTGSMGNMAINTVDEDKMSKPKEPLVVNGSSVGAKTSISSQGGKSCELLVFPVALLVPQSHLTPYFG